MKGIKFFYSIKTLLSIPKKKRNISIFETKKEMSEIGTNIKLKEKLGEGGFGSVHRCLDESGKEIAVKICDNAKNGIPHLMEMSIMATYNHPNINRALRIYSKGLKLYIFQDLAKDDLSKYVRNDKNPTIKKDLQTLRYWMSCIVSGLACLHANNIVHADLKTSNVLIFSDTDVRLSDFTVSCKKWSSEMKFNNTVGTSTHRPLENHLGREWSFPLDIWCLGVTFWEIVYGELLFPYQGNFPDKKEHLTERCVNCLIDWASRGPKSQRYDVVPNKYDFKRFVLPSNWHDDPFKLNDLLLKMLRLNPEERCKMPEIMNHPFFSGLVKVECKTLSAVAKKVSSKEINLITQECSSLFLGSLVTNHCIDLYSRITDDLGSLSVKTKIRGCLWISSKIVLRKTPKGLKNEKKIISAERDICAFLGYHLHHM